MASNSIGRIGLDLCLNKNAFNKEINNVGAYAQNTLSKSFRGIGKVLGGVVAGIGIAKFTKDCISLGSNLAEVQNVVDVTFGDMSACIDDFAQNQTLGFGLSETSAKQYTGVLGAMLKSMGVGTAQAKDMSIEMTKLAGDMASFYNLDTDLAFEKMRAGISGETEPLKQLGINMSVANLEAYAMSQGITQSYQKMDQANQSLLRYNYLMSVTADAQGDFARTGGGWANQVRVLKLQWDSFRASMGQVFIAVLLPVVQMLNKVFAKINVVTKAFAQMVSALTGSKIDVGMGSVASTIQDATGDASNLTNGIGDVGKAAKKTAKDVASATSGLDELNILSPKSDSGSEDSGASGDLGSGSSTDTSNAVGETVDETMSLSNKLFDFFKPLQNSWNKYGMGIMLNLKSAWKDIVAVAMDAGSIIASNWDSWFQAWSDGIMSVGNIFSLIFNGFTILFRSAWDNGGAYLFDQLLKLWTNLMRFSTVINDNFIAPFLYGINAFVMPAIGKLIGSGLTAIGDVIAWLNKKIVSFVDSFNLNSVTNSVTSFKDKFLNSFLSIGAAIASILVGFKAFGIISSSLSNLGSTFKVISRVISPVIKSMRVFFTLASNGLGVINASQSALFSVGQTLQASLLSVGKALLGLFNPITLIVATIASIIAGFLYLYATSKTFRDQINAIFANIGENIRGIVGGIIQIITTIYELGIKPFIDSSMAAFNSLWNNGLSVFVENVSIFVFRLIDMVMSIWNNAINPFINLLLTIFLPIFTTVWDGILAVAVPIIEKIMEYVNMFMEVLNVLMAVLNTHVWPIFKVVFDGLSEIVLGFWTFIKPIFDWFMALLSKVVSFALGYFLSPLTILFKTIVQVVKDIVGPISQVFEGIKQVFQGIIDFVMGVFTGDWSRAWDGIKGIFEGVWNSLAGVVSTVWNTILSLFGNAGSIFSGVVDGIASAFRNIVNCIISGINAVIAFPFNKINGLLNDIRETSFLGMTPFDFIPYNVLPVPKIPMLAQGGYVGANQPQLAMIGDNKRYGEIVAPEDKLNKIMNDALDAHQGQGMDTSVIEELLMMIIKILEDLDLVADIDIDGFVRLIRNKEKRLGMQIVR